MIAVATDEALALQVPVLDINQPDQVAEYIVQWLKTVNHTFSAGNFPEYGRKSPDSRPGLPGLMLAVPYSHGEAPHYHRRYGVSLLSSAWGQVGPPRCCRQQFRPRFAL